MNLLKLKQPITININQNIYRIDKPFVVRTIKPALEQDYKTAIILGIEPIPEGTELKVFSILDNYYGRFFICEYNGRKYNINPNDCEFINSLNIIDCLTKSDKRKIYYYLLKSFTWLPLEFISPDPQEFAERLWNNFLELSDESKRQILIKVL